MLFRKRQNRLRDVSFAEPLEPRQLLAGTPLTAAAPVVASDASSTSQPSIAESASNPASSSTPQQVPASDASSPASSTENSPQTPATGTAAAAPSSAAAANSSTEASTTESETAGSETPSVVQSVTDVAQTTVELATNTANKAVSTVASLGQTVVGLLPLGSSAAPSPQTANPSSSTAAETNIASSPQIAVASETEASENNRQSIETAKAEIEPVGTAVASEADRGDERDVADAAEPKDASVVTSPPAVATPAASERAPSTTAPAPNNVATATDDVSQQAPAQAPAPMATAETRLVNTTSTNVAPSEQAEREVLTARVEAAPQIDDLHVDDELAAFSEVEFVNNTSVDDSLPPLSSADVETFDNLTSAPASNTPASMMVLEESPRAVDPNLPAGLAKRDELPAGLAKQESLPNGLAKRTESDSLPTASTIAEPIPNESLAVADLSNTRTADTGSVPVSETTDLQQLADASTSQAADSQSLQIADVQLVAAQRPAADSEAATAVVSADVGLEQTAPVAAASHPQTIVGVSLVTEVARTEASPQRESTSQTQLGDASPTPPATASTNDVLTVQADAEIQLVQTPLTLSIDASLARSLPEAPAQLVDSVPAPATPNEQATTSTSDGELPSPTNAAAIDSVAAAANEAPTPVDVAKLQTSKATNSAANPPSDSAAIGNEIRTNTVQPQLDNAVAAKPTSQSEAILADNLAAFNAPSDTATTADRLADSGTASTTHSIADTPTGVAAKPDAAATPKLTSTVAANDPTVDSTVEMTVASEVTAALDFIAATASAMKSHVVTTLDTMTIHAAQTAADVAVAVSTTDHSHVTAAPAASPQLRVAPPESTTSATTQSNETVAASSAPFALASQSASEAMQTPTSPIVSADSSLATEVAAAEVAASAKIMTPATAKVSVAPTVSIEWASTDVSSPAIASVTAPAASRAPAAAETQALSTWDAAPAPIERTVAPATSVEVAAAFPTVVHYHTASETNESADPPPAAEPVVSTTDLNQQFRGSIDPANLLPHSATTGSVAANLNLPPTFAAFSEEVEEHRFESSIGAVGEPLLEDSPSMAASNAQDLLPGVLGTAGATAHQKISFSIQHLDASSVAKSDHTSWHTESEPEPRNASGHPMDTGDAAGLYAHNKTLHQRNDSNQSEETPDATRTDWIPAEAERGPSEVIPFHPVSTPLPIHPPTETPMTTAVVLGIFTPALKRIRQQTSRPPKASKIRREEKS
ncbi:hypothetical protein CA51_08040 [Rosistilla oblonga]|uniref:hypothetical protein n=1 Tax=Rosistilla oblonga TaxID=2527990 RepID=UPI00118CA477|nr:hypothetical protein [Rosistilla oblonga]QDV10945.1 hypothetical protein CA51_08040 [Rosistilla oblonga]